MPSIRELVTDVEQQRASAFSVLGGSALMLTVDGNSQPGAQLSEADINGIVESDLNQDQQTDIMVGRPVGLSLDINGATWRVLVQPMPTGIAIRGTREGAPPAAAATVSSEPDGFGVGVPLDDDDELSIVVDGGGEQDYPPTPPPGELDAFDLGGGVPAPFEDPGTPPPVAPDPFEAPIRGGHVAPAQDDGFGMVEAPAMSPEEREVTLFENSGGAEAGSGVGGHESTLLQVGGAVQAPPPDPTDPGGDIGGMTDGTLLMQHSPKVHPPAAPEPAMAPPPGPLDGISLPDMGGGQPQVPPAPVAAAPVPPAPMPSAPTPSAPDAPRPRERSNTGSHGTLMAMRPPGMGPAQSGQPGPQSQPPQRKSSPSRHLPRHPTGQGPRSEELEASALCFCRELKEAFEAGGRMGMGVEVIDESDIVDGHGPTLKYLGVEPGATLIVDLDDPSRLLGWILLRREEGFRVFVVTRARGPGGARRILLGIDATERAEAWLDEHPVYALIGGAYQPI